jgi:sortase A
VHAAPRPRLIRTRLIRPRLTLPKRRPRRTPSPTPTPTPAPEAKTTTRATAHPLSDAVAIPIWIVTTVRLVAAWCLAYALGLSGLQEQHDQGHLYDQFRENLAEATVPIGGAIAAGTPVALLQLPVAGAHKLVVVEGTSSSDLREGPGHRRDTPLPGQAGVAVVFGRGATFGAPFRNVSDLPAGADLTVTTGQGVFHYKVDRVRRPGDPLPPVLAPTSSRLTLVSATGSGWRSGWTASRMVYVDASLVGKVQPTPAGRPTAVSSAEQAMHINRSALMPLVLWLQLLVVAAIAVAWARERWGRWQTWLVGTPVLLAALWGASSSASGLLPNLF